MRQAEDLIEQLPSNHEGRNSWLFNFAGNKHRNDLVCFGEIPAEVKMHLEDQDWTDASQEVANALVEMGWVWVDGLLKNEWPCLKIYTAEKRFQCVFVGQVKGKPYYTPEEFLKRAKNTAEYLGLKPPVKPELKEGDWVAVNGPSGLSDRSLYDGVVGQIQPYDTPHARKAWLIDPPGAWFLPENLRHATSEEITAHEAKVKEAEWAKVTELQDGDCCKVSAEEKKEIIESAREAGIINIGGYQNHNWLFYRPKGVVKITGLREDPDPKWKDFQELTFTEFKRRLLGTIARLKAEAQAAEDAKLVFGARVRYKDGEEGLYWFSYRGLGRHVLVFDGAGKLVVPRHEFTLID